MVYLDVVEGRHNIRYSATVGDCKPLHSSAIGKAMLGQLDERQLAALLDRLALAKITPETIVEPGALASDIASGRVRGYFVTRGENVADVMACARTIDFAGVSYGIAVAGPLPRMQMMEGKIAAALLAACGDIDEVA